MLCAGTVLFLGVTALLAGIISTDFTKYFIIFHKIFFTNDLWQLDPRTDLLINIVPEPFFMDTAARIGITFCLMTGACFFSALHVSCGNTAGANQGQKIPEIPEVSALQVVPATRLLRI